MPLTVRVVQGWDLMVADTASSDPFCVLKDFHTGEEIGRTETISNTTRPQWVAKCPVPADTSCLLVEVFDHDTFSANDPMGMVRVPLLELEPGAESDAWYTLTRGPPRKQGALRVQIAAAPAPAPTVAAVAGGGEREGDAASSTRRAPIDKAAYLHDAPDALKILFGGFGALQDFPRNEAVQLDVRNVKRGGQEESALIVGKLLVTTHRIIFAQSEAADAVSPPDDGHQWWALASVLEAHVETFDEPASQAQLGALWLKLKDSRELQFSLLPVDGRDGVAGGADGGGFTRIQALERIAEDMKWLVAENTFAFARPPPALVQPVPLAARPDADQPPPALPQLGAPAFDMRLEMAAQGVGAADPACKWRLTTANENYELCPTYPSVFAVPACIDDATLKAASRYRFKHRVPAVTWCNPRSGAVLCRSAQPLHEGATGMIGRATPEDDRLLGAIRDAAVSADAAGGATAASDLVAAAASKKAGAAARAARTARRAASEPKLFVIDARPRLNAEGNMLKGGGFEDVTRLGGPERAQLDFMGIGNIHVMRHSLRDLGTACGSPSGGHNFFERLHHSGWLYHVAGVLRASAGMALQLDAGAPMLVHCSDGWDRTSQLAATAQLLLVPRYRTRDGFRALVEKDWCSFGHMCAERCGFADPHELSPILLQWLDCVWQLWRQFPSAFEFNEHMLRFLVEALYSNWFGTFLGNSEQERRKMRTAEETVSVWECVRLNWAVFENPTYRPVDAGVTTQLLKPSCDVRSLRLWDAVYMKELEVVLRIKAKQQGMPRVPAEVPSAALPLSHGTRHISPRREISVNVTLEQPATLWWRFNTEAPANTLHFGLRDAVSQDVIIASTKTECKSTVVGSRDVPTGQYELTWSNYESIVKTKVVHFEVLKQEL
eukprot:g837.t1